jgi:hypothetical protein
MRRQLERPDVLSAVPVVGLNRREVYANRTPDALREYPR